MDIIYFLFGYVICVCDNKDLLHILDICNKNSVRYKDLTSDGECASFKIKLFSYKRLYTLCKIHDLNIAFSEPRGLMGVLYKYRKRYGLMLGIAISCLMIMHFESFLWDVNIKGNNELTSSSILDLLKEYGVFAGAKISDIETANIENSILKERDDIAWISLNIQGNIANVEIRELKSYEKPKKKFANLTAKKSGIVEYVQIFSGAVSVKSGQYVNEGDLLVSGIYDSKASGFRFTRASGSVIARTSEEFLIEIPLEYEEKCYTGAVNYEKSLNFFGYSIKISKNYGKSMVFYDTIYREEDLVDGSVLNLPFEIHTVSQLEYQNQLKSRSYDNALNMAYFELMQKIKELGDITVLSKTLTTEQKENCLILKCTLLCLEDIACISEFDVDLSLKE